MLVVSYIFLPVNNFIKNEIILIPNLLNLDDLNLLNSSINLDTIVKSALPSTIGLISFSEYLISC